MDFFTTDNELKMLLALAALKVVNEYLDRWGLIDRFSPFFGRVQSFNVSLSNELSFIKDTFKDQKIDLTELQAAETRLDELGYLLANKRKELEADG
jgi:stalled ribosome rescue protein Dom34